MIPRLTSSTAVSNKVRTFLQELEKLSDFQGEIDEALSSRVVLATDNSVYQVLPEAIIFPRTEMDISLIFKLAITEQFRDLSFAPRGGGTGTNGQSLHAGIVIDCSRHMNHILEVNLDEGWVLVEPGVVLDQLNEYLKPYDRFFAPTLSPSNRATIGGMVNTDASGKGSKLYGKTSQHVLAITAVYLDGQIHTSEEIDVILVEKMKRLPGFVGQFYAQLEQTIQEHQKTINKQLPQLHRFITGYNLTRIYSDDGKRFNANYALTGSEGTLAYVSKIKLKLTAIPKYRCLFVVLYSSFSDALDHAKHLVEFEPEAIETMDGTILNLAKTDIIYYYVQSFLTSRHDNKINAINLIEFVAHEEKALSQYEKSFKQTLTGYDFHFVTNNEDIANLWELRKRSVGLLGKVKGARKPISGVEDTIVPPVHLANYVKEFRELLDSHGLSYGMYGHIDVGCLHVRPEFNLMEEKDRQIYYEIIEKVAKLTQEYGGVLWGEHGKGFRSEFVPMFFGDELYTELRKIKSSCDPYNQLNPGKIAIPLNSDEPLINIRSEKTRAASDGQINNQFLDPYHLPLSCNGNGACFDYNYQDVMCPSYKMTRNRIHSPKGRASLVREWLRQLSLSSEVQGWSWPLEKQINTYKKHHNQYDFSHEVYAALEGCLGCQACKSQCPVNIDVPSFKAKFLQAYHTRYARSLKDLLIAYSERVGYLQSLFPKLNNYVLSHRWVRWFLGKYIGLVDPPLFSNPNLHSLLKKENIPWLDLNHLPSKNKSIVYVQDGVTSFYEAELVSKVCLFIKKMGFDIYVLPWLENGKTLHVTGMLKSFAKNARKNALLFQKISDHGLTMVGLDPIMVLTYRYEYPEYSHKGYNSKILLIQEWLSAVIASEEAKELQIQTKESFNDYLLLSHCTEQANCSEALEQWKDVFKFFGLTLTLEKTGCCGMAGSYGHEAIHQLESHGLFDLSWRNYFKDNTSFSNTLVDGYSCRAQVKRLTGLKAQHPIEILLGLLK
ncbi:FAD-linked oxidoreductase [Legionella lansingensis]|uniref:D-2-hydroxyglutarate dehydrogenase n=1 Tax=Legionella lansingensis TaxID=45067 RepID=A0A0W0VTS1_9GAMM|nr:FAD-binding and (Fe-S)-binding domain-containing protein [Legionella lansingensis]KTD23448.1 oxidase [Legionella lansingensis]SNV50874.1 FAD-linked oxidoreductase [Legionella lansingensis]